MNDEEFDSLIEGAEVTAPVSGINKQLAAKKISQAQRLLEKKMKASYYGEDSVMESKPIDMSKEYSILSEGGSYSLKSKMVGLYAFVSSTVESDQVDLVDLNATKSNIDNHFKYLFLKKRFTEMKKNATVNINYDYNGFYVGDSVFESLDEVEKALANKAFL